jgi:hypothetical protein
MDGSLDLLPGEKARKMSPDFQYIGSPVRKKQERKALPAFECIECRNYYNGKETIYSWKISRIIISCVSISGANLTGEELKVLNNLICSRRSVLDFFILTLGTNSTVL